VKRVCTLVEARGKEKRDQEINVKLEVRVGDEHRDGENEEGKSAIWLQI